MEKSSHGTREKEMKRNGRRKNIKTRGGLLFRGIVRAGKLVGAVSVHCNTYGENLPFLLQQDTVCGKKRPLRFTEISRVDGKKPVS